MRASPALRRMPKLIQGLIPSQRLFILLVRIGVI